MGDDMSIRPIFDAEKAIEVLLYITKRCPDTYTALKVLYFADKDHLSKYGRLICDDTYMAMAKGPVPSGVYNLIKYVRGDSFYWDFPVPDVFTVQDDYTISPKRKANLDLLSESEMECLDKAIEEYGHLSFDELVALSHDDDAHKSSDRNDRIPIEAIVKSLQNGELLLDYLQSL